MSRLTPPAVELAQGCVEAGCSGWLVSRHAPQAVEVIQGSVEAGWLRRLLRCGWLVWLGPPDVEKVLDRVEAASPDVEMVVDRVEAGCPVCRDGGGLCRGWLP